MTTKSQLIEKHQLSVIYDIALLIKNWHYAKTKNLSISGGSYFSSRSLRSQRYRGHGAMNLIRRLHRGKKIYILKKTWAFLFTMQSFDWCRFESWLWNVLAYMLTVTTTPVLFGAASHAADRCTRRPSQQTCAMFWIADEWNIYQENKFLHIDGT